VIVLGRRLQDVELFTLLIKQTNKMELEINVKNTKLMTVSQNPYNENAYLQLSTYNFVTERVC
jgi:hypothetical protein